MALTNETKVGSLVAITALLAFVFVWAIGIHNPFSSSLTFYVTYRFAGGIKVGSPVRISGIQAGKVERIEFFTPTNSSVPNLRGLNLVRPDQQEAIVPLKLTLSIQKEAAFGVRKDSHFYINLAGIIGERYVEITPGHLHSPQVCKGDVLAGIDPPRIDQLISQSFDLAGKIGDVIEENRGDLTRSIELLVKLSRNLNQTLTWVDKSAIFKTDFSQLTGNLIAITSNVKKMMDRLGNPEGEKTLTLLHELLWRLEPLDSKAIRQFFQKEGVKVKLF